MPHLPCTVGRVEDANAQVALCAALGLTAAAWKSNGLAIYQPSPAELLAAMDKLHPGAQSRLAWRIQARNSQLRSYLKGRSAALDEREQLDYIFQPLQG